MSVTLVRQLPIDPMEGTWHYYVAGDPTAGYPAIAGSLITRVDQGAGHGLMYKKTGANDTDWSQTVTGGSGSASTATTSSAGVSRVDNNSAGDPQALTAAGHLLDADPHPQYALDSEKGATNGLATLTGSTLTASQLPLGSSASTACAGNDARLSDARTPLAHAASHASAGSDPLTLSESQVTNLVTDLAGKVATSDARLSDSRTPLAHASTHQPGGADAMAVDAVAATGSLRTLGTGAQQATSGTDSRLSDARTPTAHAVSHASGGGDPVTLAESQVTNLTTDLAAKEVKTNKGIASGYAGLGTDSLVPAAQTRSPTLRASASVALSASTTINITALDLAVLSGDTWVLDYYIPVTVSGGTVGLKPIFTGVTSTLAGTMDCQGSTSAVTATTYARSTTPTTALGTAFITALFTGFIWVRAVITVSVANGSIRFGLTTSTSAAGNILAGASLMATKV